MLAEGGRTLITQFEYARAGHDRALTIAREIAEDLEKNYQAPECFGDPSAAAPASDVFSLGLILYELFAGRRPFADPAAIFDRSAAFPEKPSKWEPRLPRGFDEWLQGLCAFEPGARPPAREALKRLDALLPPRGK
jgi:serine/threonine protein kinase